ncbi:MAG: response regulator [Candidatus Sumerlaeia bacterium]|nr:response regulator [Candidatus Sumerlaeia bacterium]
MDQMLEALAAAAATSCEQKAPPQLLLGLAARLDRSLGIAGLTLAYAGSPDSWVLHVVLPGVTSPTPRLLRTSGRWGVLEAMRSTSHTLQERTLPGDVPEIDQCPAEVTALLQPPTASIQFGLHCSRSQRWVLGFWMPQPPAVGSREESILAALAIFFQRELCLCEDRAKQNEVELARFRLLHEASWTVAASVDQLEIARTMQAIVQRRLPIEAFAVTLAGGATQSARTILTSGDPTDLRACAARDKLLGLLAKGITPTPDTVHEPGKGWLLGDGWRASRAALYLPLVSAKRLVGIVALHTDGDSVTFEGEQPFLESLANIAGSAMEKARGYQELYEARAVWENTLDAVSDLVVLTDAQGRVRWINQAASVHLFRGASGWFEQPIASIALLRPLAPLYEGGRFSDPTAGEIAADLPDPTDRKRRYRVRTRVMHGIGAAGPQVVHVLSPQNFALSQVPAPVARPVEPPRVEEDRITTPTLEPDPDTSTWTVLVVDDEALLANALSRGLGVLGHRVSSYQYGRAVLEEREALLRRADLAVVDMRLPDMDGVEVIRRLNALNPRMRFVLTSGTQLSDDVLGDIKAPSAILQKPFRLDDFNRAIEQLML